MAETLFGTPLRTDTLVLVAALGETYPSELAALLKRPLYGVQRALSGLEQAGAIATRRRGTIRLVSMEPRYFAHEELYALALRLSRLPRYENIVKHVRRRPRAIGKPL